VAAKVQLKGRQSSDEFAFVRGTIDNPNDQIISHDVIVKMVLAIREQGEG